jgi:hypothetical protein
MKIIIHTYIHTLSNQIILYLTQIKLKILYLKYLYSLDFFHLLFIIKNSKKIKMSLLKSKSSTNKSASLSSNSTTTMPKSKSKTLKRYFFSCFSRRYNYLLSELYLLVKQLNHFSIIHH